MVSPQVLGRVSKPQFYVTLMLSLQGLCQKLSDGNHAYTCAYIHSPTSKHCVYHPNPLKLLVTLRGLCNRGISSISHLCAILWGHKVKGDMILAFKTCILTTYNRFTFKVIWKHWRGNDSFSLGPEKEMGQELCDSAILKPNTGNTFYTPVLESLK